MREEGASEFWRKVKKLEARVVSDLDVKLTMGKWVFFCAAELFRSTSGFLEAN